MANTATATSGYSTLTDSTAARYLPGSGGTTVSSANAVFPPPVPSLGGFLDQESMTGGYAPTTQHIRFFIPDLEQKETIMVFNSDETVWMVKQKLLATVCKTLKDGLNYGLFIPSANGRAGKFLDEERPLKDYPLQGPIGLLEFKYKRRVYKIPVANHTAKLKKLHSQTNLRKFMELVEKGDADKITEMVNSGLDPNFISGDSRGNTPLTLSATLQRPRTVMLALVSGGAFLDYRNRASLTAMHVAAQIGNKDALRTLLDLGGSPNYKDDRGLTPLYLSVLNDTNPQCVQILLHDRAELGVRDDKEWTEVHHACRNGRVQHLEHLLFYGADMNAQTILGETPLHICAKHNVEECARALMFRGASKTLVNINNEDARQTALQAGHNALAEVIANFKPEEIVLYQELPKYNEKRRGTISMATIRNLQRSRSNPQLHLLFPHQPDGSGPSNGWTSSLSSAVGHHYLSNGFLSNRNNHNFDSASTTSSQELEWSHNTRTVVVESDHNGYGFVLRGARSRPGKGSTLDFVPSLEIPALQYFDRVEPSSAADAAGLVSGDYILEINGENIMNATHERTVSLIKQSGSKVILKVVTVSRTPVGNRTGAGAIHAAANIYKTTPQQSRAAPPVMHSLSPSIGSRTLSTLNGLEELERLDATLDKYDIDNSSQSDTSSVRNGNISRISTASIPSSFRPSNDAILYPNEPSASGHMTYTTRVELHPEPKVDYISANSEPVPDYNDDEEDPLYRSIRVSEAHSTQSSLVSSSSSSPRGRAPAPPPAGGGAAPPAPPPPPPLPAPSSNGPQMASVRSITSNSTRPQLQILEESKKYDDTHAALVAAIQRRRDILESTDMSRAAESIDHLVKKSSQTSQTVYRSDQSRPIKTPPVVPSGFVGLLDVPGGAAKMNGGHHDGSVSAVVTNGHKSPASSTSASDYVVSDEMGYTAIAEKARQEYLRKQAAALASAASGASSGAATPAFTSAPKTVPIVSAVAPETVRPANVSTKVYPVVPASKSAPAVDVAVNGNNNNSNYIDSKNSDSTDSHAPVVSRSLKTASGNRQSTLGTNVIYTSNNTSNFKQSPLPPPVVSAPSTGGIEENDGVKRNGAIVKPTNGTAPHVASDVKSKPIINSNVVYTNANGGGVKHAAPQPQKSWEALMLPPPPDFATAELSEFSNPVPVTSTLRNVAQVTSSNSMLFRAKPSAASALSAKADVGKQNGSSGGIKSWSTEDVGEWLENLDYGVYRDKFAEMNIDGQKLIDMKQNDFVALGVTAILHQVKLEREVRKELKNGSGLMA